MNEAAADGPPVVEVEDTVVLGWRSYAAQRSGDGRRRGTWPLNFTSRSRFIFGIVTPRRSLGLNRAKPGRRPGEVVCHHICL